jgi:hypothetical protein
VSLARHYNRIDQKRSFSNMTDRGSGNGRYSKGEKPRVARSDRTGAGTMVTHKSLHVVVIGVSHHYMHSFEGL